MRDGQINRTGKPMIHPLFAVVDEDLADATTEPILETMSPVPGRPLTGVVATILQARGWPNRSSMPNAWSALFCPMC